MVVYSTAGMWQPESQSWVAHTGPRVTLRLEGIPAPSGRCSHLYWGAQHWSQCSRCGLASAEQRGRIRPSSCWWCSSRCSPGCCQLPLPRRHLAGSCSTRKPRAFSAELLSSRWAPAMSGGTRLCLPSCRTWLCPSLNWQVPAGHLRSLWLAAGASQVCISYRDLLKVCTVGAVPRSLMKMVNTVGPGLTPGTYCALFCSNPNEQHGILMPTAIFYAWDPRWYLLQHPSFHPLTLISHLQCKMQKHLSFH